MKRYGLSIGIVVLIVLCISTFYLNAASSRYPDYILVKQDGDEKAAEGVSFLGTLHFQMNANVTIDSSGSVYSNQGSIYQRTNSFGIGHVSQLIEEHRSFMRGKRSLANLYEDDHLLVHASVEAEDTQLRDLKNFSIEVSVLDKDKQNETWSYKVNVPDSKLYHYMYVEDVQVFGDEIIIIANTFNSVGSEYHRYSLGITNDRVLSDQVIQLPQPMVSEQGANFRIQKVYETSTTQANTYSAFYTIPLPTMAVETQEQTTGLVATELIVYNMQTGLEMKIDSVELKDMVGALSGNKFMNFILEGDYLFMTKMTEQGIQVLEYSIPNSKMTRYDFPAEPETLTQIKNHRLYALTNSGINPPTLAIIDMGSGETIYQGNIEIKGAERNDAEELQKLSFHQLNLE